MIQKPISKESAETRHQKKVSYGRMRIERKVKGSMPSLGDKGSKLLSETIPS